VLTEIYPDAGKFTSRYDSVTGRAQVQMEKTVEEVNKIAG